MSSVVPKHEESEYGTGRERTSQPGDIIERNEACRGFGDLECTGRKRPHASSASASLTLLVRSRAAARSKSISDFRNRDHGFTSSVDWFAEDRLHRRSGPQRLTDFFEHLSGVHVDKFLLARSCSWGTKRCRVIRS